MPLVWKTKKARPRVKKWGPFTITREDRRWMPDRITKVTMKDPNPFKIRRETITIYEAR